MLHTMKEVYIQEHAGALRGNAEKVNIVIKTHKTYEMFAMCFLVGDIMHKIINEQHIS